MRNNINDIPNFLLGHTEIDKNVANYHQFQEKRYSLLKQSFGLCQLQSRKTLPTVGNFLAYHGNWFVFLFYLSIHVRSLKTLHPNVIQILIITTFIFHIFNEHFIMCATILNLQQRMILMFEMFVKYYMKVFKGG